MIEVDLRTHSDFVLTVVAEMVSLVPGSLVVEARRSTHTLFLHVLDARDQAGVDDARAGASPWSAASSSPSAPTIDHLRPPARPRLRPLRGALMNAVLAHLRRHPGRRRAAAACIRISLGPTMLDRAVALDVLVAVMICGLALEAAVNRHTTTLPILVVLVPARLRRVGQHRPVHPRQRRRRGGAVMSWTAVADVVAAACLLLGALLDPDRRDRHPAVPRRAHPDALRHQAPGARPAAGPARARPPAARPEHASGCWPWSALFQLVTTPVASHMVGRASFRAGQVRRDLLVVDELSDVLPPRGVGTVSRCGVDSWPTATESLSDVRGGPWGTSRWRLVRSGSSGRRRGGGRLQRQGAQPSRAGVGRRRKRPGETRRCSCCSPPTTPA